MKNKNIIGRQFLIKVKFIISIINLSLKLNKKKNKIKVIIIKISLIIMWKNISVEIILILYKNKIKTPPKNIKKRIYLFQEEKEVILMKMHKKKVFKISKRPIAKGCLSK